METQLQTKDVFIKEIELSNDKLRILCQKAGFDMFCKIRKEIQKESTHVVSGPHVNVLIDIENEVAIQEQKYLVQEKQILHLQEENHKLKTRIQQMEFFG